MRLHLSSGWIAMRLRNWKGLWIYVKWFISKHDAWKWQALPGTCVIIKGQSTLYGFDGGHTQPCWLSLQLLVVYACLVSLAQVEDKPLAEETTARRGSGKCVGLVYVKCSPWGTYWLPSVQGVGFLFYMRSTMLLRGSEICCLEIMKPLHFKVTSNDQSGLQ